jgi:hypothetical protein
MEQQGGLSDAGLARRALSAGTRKERKAAFTGIADRHHLTVFRQCTRWFLSSPSRSVSPPTNSR